MPYNEWHKFCDRNGWARDFGIVMKKSNMVCFDAFTPSLAHIYHPIGVPLREVESWILPAEKDNGIQYPWRRSTGEVELRDDEGNVHYGIAVQGPPDDLPDWYLLNHSNLPNLEIKKVSIHGYPPSRLIYCFVANQNIEPGTELTFQYEAVTAAFN